MHQQKLVFNNAHLRKLDRER